MQKVKRPWKRRRKKSKRYRKSIVMKVPSSTKGARDDQPRCYSDEKWLLKSADVLLEPPKCRDFAQHPKAIWTCRGVDHWCSTASCQRDRREHRAVQQRQYSGRLAKIYRISTLSSYTDTGLRLLHNHIITLQMKSTSLIWNYSSI